MTRKSLGTLDRMGPSPIDYRKFYFLEKYLFDEVASRFRGTGEIAPADFYMILIWKANRAKTRIRERLKTKCGSFAKAVTKIALSLYASSGPKRRLEILMKKWGFRLPMATAILAVLYPNDFTVYDVRVCDELNAFHSLTHRQFSGKLWADYQRFIEGVKSATPNNLSLRDKDRYLWGRSFHKQTLLDVKN